MFIYQNNQRLALLSVLIIIALVLGGCGIDDDKKTIYDDAQRIAQAGDSYSFYKRSEKKDEQQVEIRYSRFYGVQTIWVIEFQQQGEIILNYDSQVNNGKFKVVLITPEGQVIKVAEQNSRGSFTFGLPKGKYTVKIVGNNANGAIRLERPSL